MRRRESSRAASWGQHDRAITRGQVIDPHRHRGLELLQFPAQFLRGQVLGGIGQPAHFIGKAGFRDEQFQVLRPVGHPVDLLGLGGVGGEQEGGVVVLHQVAHAGHQVVDRYRGDAQSFQFVGSAGKDLGKTDDRVVGARDHREIRPDLVVEEMPPEGVEGPGQGPDLHRHVGVPVDVLGEERQAADVVQVGMGNEDLPDADLLRHRERLGERPGVDGHAAVHQESGQPVSFGLSTGTP